MSNATHSTRQSEEARAIATERRRMERDRSKARNRARVAKYTVRSLTAATATR